MTTIFRTTGKKPLPDGKFVSRKEIVRKARKRLRKSGVDVVCTDRLSDYKERELTKKEFNDIVDEVVNDTLWREGKY